MREGGISKPRGTKNYDLSVIIKNMQLELQFYGQKVKITDSPLIFISSKLYFFSNFLQNNIFMQKSLAFKKFQP